MSHVGTSLAPHVTPTNAAVMLVSACVILPLMASQFYACFRLVFGVLFPAYRSYKAVSTKNVKEYVKWMMYWIVFAFFTCAETFTDILLAFWFPFYYEIKIILVIWLLSPVTKGSSILYRKFVHPQLAKREAEIDSYILRAKQQGYNTVLKLGANGLNFARDLIVQAALNGREGIVEQLKRSYSLSDLVSETDDGGHRGDTRPPNRRAITLAAGEIDEIVGGPPQAVDMLYDSETDTADGPTISSGYGSAQDNVNVNVGDGSETTVRQRATRKTQKTSSKKSAHTEDPTYATLPRSSKRLSRKRVIPEY